MMFNQPNAASYVAEPLRVASADELDWYERADVVVIGYGAAGACAALEAKANKADVLVIERFEGGGATTLSGGIIYAGGTPYQHEAGIDDSAEEMYKYLKLEIGDVVREETLRRFCEQSTANLAWLTEHGVGFGTNVYARKRSYPPKGYDIYYSGNESAPKYQHLAKVAPRGHRVAGKGYTGEELFDALSASAEKQGVRVHRHSLAQRLVVDSDNTVVGVEVSRLPEGSEAYKEHQKIIKKVNGFDRFVEKKALASAEKARAVEAQAGERVLIRANNGVVLTTGSFAFNREMVRHYAPKYRDAMALGTISCDGSGVLLGQSVGAAVGSMDSVTAWRSISPSEEFVKAMVVNKEGRRFISEDTYLGHLGNAMADQTDQQAWIIIDSATYWRAYSETIPRWGEESYIEFRGPLLLNLLFNSTRGRNLAQLAEKIGVDPDGLKDELASYNQSVAEGNDKFDKKQVNCRALNDGSYWAIDISVGSKKFLCPTIPMGGLRVDEDSGHVLNDNGTPIAGLYAAGRAAVGIPSGFYVSGSSIADGVFSGRRAGYHAAVSSPSI